MTRALLSFPDGKLLRELKASKEAKNSNKRIDLPGQEIAQDSVVAMFNSIATMETMLLFREVANTKVGELTGLCLLNHIWERLGEYIDQMEVWEEELERCERNDV